MSQTLLSIHAYLFIYFLVFIYLVCLKNQPMQSNCNPNFCQLVKCGEGDSCRINPCGTCRPECYDAKGNRAISPRGQLLLFLYYFILFWQSKRRNICSTIHVIPPLLHWIHPTSYVLTSNTLILCLNWTGVSVRFNTVSYLLRARLKNAKIQNCYASYCSNPGGTPM